MDDDDDHRLIALDGLRGVAALVVAFAHVLTATDDVLWRAAFEPGIASGLRYSLSYTPLSIVWAGSAAVVVFFVLSGYVLALPYLTGRTLVLRRYAPARLVRLYLPVSGAVALAVLLRAAIERNPSPGQTGWLRSQGVPLDPGDVVRSLTLTNGNPAASTAMIDNVLWSLHWEVVFSLALPLVVVVAALAARSPRRLAAAALGCLGVVALGSAHSETRFLPPLVLGSLLATQHGRLRRTSPSRVVETAGLVFVVVLLSAYAWLKLGDRALAAVGVALADHLGAGAVTAGACLTVALAATGVRVGAVLTCSPLRWAGSRSFSLYLVHVPIIVTLVYAARLGTATTLVIGLPASLVGAELFFRLVEHPAHRLARRIATPRAAQPLPGERAARPPVQPKNTSAVT